MRTILIFFVYLFIFSSQVFSQNQDTNHGTMKKEFVLYEDLPSYCDSVTTEMIQCFLKAKKVSDLSSLMDVSPFFSCIKELEKKVDDNFSKMKQYDYYMLCSAYKISWGIIMRLHLWDKGDKEFRERVVRQFKRSLAQKGPHHIAMTTLLWFDIATPEEISQMKASAWNYIEKSDNLLILESFCNIIQFVDPDTKKIIGDAKDIKRLENYIKQVDYNLPSGKRAIEITNYAYNVIACYLDPTRLGDAHGLSWFVERVSLAESEKLGPITFLDEKVIKERAAAKAEWERAIREAPETAKRLVANESGRLKAMKVIANIQEPNEIRRAMKDTLSLYYFDKKNEQGEDYDEKASSDEVKTIRELLKSENQKIKSDALDIIRSARCVSLIPDLFEMCYGKNIPPYMGFGLMEIDPKTGKPSPAKFFQFSPTFVIGCLGDGRVIPELEKLANSVTVSESMKQDARLAIKMIRRRKKEEDDRLVLKKEQKHLIAEGKLVVAEAGGPMDVKMNPFYDPTEKLVDPPTTQERPKNSRTWTSLEGWYSLDAVIIRKEGENVILARDKDGKEITVSVKRLSTQDQNYIKNWIPHKNN
jgi:hypothetical protein